MVTLKEIAFLPLIVTLSHWAMTKAEQSPGTPKQKPHTREDGKSANKCQKAHLLFET